MLAFSTCWNNSRHTDGEAMIEEIVGLGFAHIELSHGMTISKLPGIRRPSSGGSSAVPECITSFPRRWR